MDPSHSTVNELHPLFKLAIEDLLVEIGPRSLEFKSFCQIVSVIESLHRQVYRESATIELGVGILSK